MIKIKFMVKVEYMQLSRKIDRAVIKHAIEDYLNSVSGFYFETVEVEEK